MLGYVCVEARPLVAPRGDSAVTLSWFSVDIATSGSTALLLHYCHTGRGRGRGGVGRDRSGGYFFVFKKRLIM